MKNESKVAEDKRPIVRIIYEKATFGAAPLHFQVVGDSRWHPCQFVNNPDLASVSFSDGSVYYVNGTDKPSSDSGDSPLPSAELAAHADPDSGLEDFEADLTDAVTGSVTETGNEQDNSVGAGEFSVNLRSLFQPPSSSDNSTSVDDASETPEEK